MSVTLVFEVLSTYATFSHSTDDDWADRLNHQYTVAILVLFTAFVSGKTYVGNSIECLCPAHFPDSWIDYTNGYCFIKNTYYIPLDEPIPVQKDLRHRKELPYYQWVPVILILMAFLFKSPAWFWRMFNSGSGINMEKIVEMSYETQLGGEEDRWETVNRMTKYLDRWIDAHRQYKSSVMVRLRQQANKFMFFFCSNRDGNYLVGLYLFIKFLYVINVIAQFYVLNGFMGDWYRLYGFEVLRGFVNEKYWHESSRFPKVTMCDFEIRQLQNIQPHTVQCVLSINLFNEKIFIFLWFWLVMVATFTCGNFLFWLGRALFMRNHVEFVKSYLVPLKKGKRSDDRDMPLMRGFADHYLRDDGVFVLRMIERNTSDILTTELIKDMFSNYKRKIFRMMEQEHNNLLTEENGGQRDTGTINLRHIHL